MTNEIELKLLREINKLKKEIEHIKGIKEEITSYKYSKIKEIELKSLVDIEIKIDENIFNQWFNNEIVLSNDVIDFLTKLLKKEKRYIKIYKEEDLKIKFITPVLNHIDFKISDKIRDFYEESLIYSTENFIFKGSTDFLVSKGYKYAEKPYFFIQEFKRNLENSDPEPQLLAELISAVELNDWKSIKGAYIVGAIWNFVILHRLDKHKYEYFISDNFDSTKINDLKDIYKNLLFIKKEIIEME